MTLGSFISKWRIDVWLVVPMLALLVLSLAMLYSLALSLGDISFSNFYRQLIFIPIGLVILLLVSMIDYRWFYHYAHWGYILSFLLLVGVLLFGQNFRGTTGWFSIGGFVWQPVEIVKILWVIWLGHFFVTSNFREFPLRSLLISAGALVVLVGLIMAQPDLGSAALLVVTWLGLAFLLSFNKKYIIGLLIILLATSLIGWSFVLADYQKDRILTFIDPQADPLGSGYNIRQSIIAIGAGELWGRGIAQGTQSQLRFLPESHTDFIFAVIGEELGFVGIIAVIAAWLFIFVRMYSLGARTKDNFSSIVLAGFVIMIGSQVIVNIGMNVGLLPVTGLGLPFVSYGRSSLLATFIAFGIIMNIGRSVRKGDSRL